MGWQRARQPEQKAERISDIHGSAAELFDEKELSDISMRDVAERAGLGKASLYHYFKTKEEVFIGLYRKELDDWLPDLETRLARLRSPTPARIAATLTSALKDHVRFCRLTALFSSVLERNLSTECLVEFKLSLLEPTTRFVSALQLAVPELSNREARDFLFQHHAIIAGLWPLAHPASAVEEILRDETFQEFRVDFFLLLNRTLEQLLQSVWK